MKLGSPAAWRRRREPGSGPRPPAPPRGGPAGGRRGPLPQLDPLAGHQGLRIEVRVERLEPLYRDAGSLGDARQGVAGLHDVDAAERPRRHMGRPLSPQLEVAPLGAGGRGPRRRMAAPVGLNTAPPRSPSQPRTRAKSRGSRPAEADAGERRLSPVEGDGFELPVPRLRNWRNSRRVGIFHFTDDGSSVLPFAAVASLPICRRRHEAANLSREQAGEFDRRRVLILRADDLQAHR